MPKANRIKEIRELRGFDQKHLAAKIGISPMGLSYIENGKNKATKWLPKIAKELDCSQDQLMGLEPTDVLAPKITATSVETFFNF